MNSMKNNQYNHSLLKLFVFFCVLGLIALNVGWVPTSNMQAGYTDAPSSGIKKMLASTAKYCSKALKDHKSCDLSKGKWVYDPSPPLYTNDTCKYIFLNQDCMKNGRPDRDYMHWRWQPNDCDLPRFDAKLFLRLMARKSILFVGDSLARNQMESLVCALAQVEDPNRVSDYQGLENVFTYPTYNFSVALAWSPFLVNYTVQEGTWHIHLDKPHDLWADVLSDYDIVILSSYYWIFRRSIYYIENRNISSYDPNGSTPPGHISALRSLWNTAMQHIVHHYSGLAILRTVSVDHFEGNAWDKGGVCSKKQPYMDPNNEMSITPSLNEVYTLQKDAVKKALESRKGIAFGPKLKILDVTYSTLLRPDGHPSTYRIQTSTEPRNDCSHWCMPGAIDSWNQMMLGDPEIMCSSYQH